MRNTFLIAASGVVLSASLGAPLVAQQPLDSVPIRARQRIEALLNLPRRADEMRRAGVPDSSVRSVLDVFVKEKVPAQDAVGILETRRDAAAEHGPTDNFGAFVQSQLAAGKRGQELAAAIRAEHQARGKGKSGNAGGGGRPDDAGRGGQSDARAPGKRPEDNMSKKPAADTARGKRPGNPNAKRPL